MKSFLLSLMVLWVIPVCLPVWSSTSPDWVPMVYTGQIPAPRTDATLVLDYHTFLPRFSNRAFLYGGKGKNHQDQDIFLDIHGQMHSLRFIARRTDDDGHPVFHWNIIQTDPFYLPRLGGNPNNMQDSTDYPPHGRFAHNAIIIPTIEAEIRSGYGTQIGRESIFLNYLVFGGVRQQNRLDEQIDGNWAVTNELYMNAQYRINGEREPRHHWYKVPQSLNQVWPSPRYHAQMLPLFSEETGIENGEYPFLVFGGIWSDGGDIIQRQDCFFGTFSRELQPADPEDTGYNEWDFDMDISVEFTEVPGHDAFHVFGAGVTFDSYYGFYDGNRRPRVIMVGGKRPLPGFPDDGNKVITIYPAKINGQYDWTAPIVQENELPDLPDINGIPQCRIHTEVVLNPRTHTLRVFGGEKQNGDSEPGILELDLTDPAAEWQWICHAFDASRHSAVYSNGTRILKRVEQNGEYATEMIWDTSEATTVSPDEPFVWNVTPDAPFGLNNPNTILNTPRLHSHDIVRIHQTRDEPGKVNDAWRVTASLPPWLENITLEGVVKNGIKPVLYTLYSDTSELPELVIPHNTKLGIVLVCGSSMTIRNIKFMHSQDILEPTDPLPVEIPEWALDKYQSQPSAELLELINQHYEPDDDIRDFVLHHNKDPALWMHTPIYIENSEFFLNGIGVTIICVSSAIRQAQVSHNRFQSCYIGALALEKQHDISYNEFRDNYLAGVVSDKGSRAVCHNNIFIGNGLFDLGENIQQYQAGFLSHFYFPDDVPNIQTPLVYNNTFVNNRRALSVTEHSEYREHMMNRPFFFNNIVSNSTEPIYLQNSDLRCDFISFHNCFHHDGSVPPVETDIGGVLSGWSLYDDPDFADSNAYLLSTVSPCLNKGLFTLNPGVMSELSYPDYGMLSIGFHQLPGTGLLPGSPVDLQISEYVLSWNESTPYPDGYLILVENIYEEYIHAEFVETNQYSFDEGPEVNYNHLYFWILPHFGRRVYNNPVMIEWME
jgi:hypothetical protein